jgi:heme O synthase-like polyprenyltransferase
MHLFSSTGRGRHLAAWLPMVACAFCPSCLVVFAALLSAAGVPTALAMKNHARWSLAAAVIAVAAVGWTSVKRRSYAPLLVALAGALGPLLAHTGLIPEMFEVASVLVFPIASLWSARSGKSAHAAGCQDCADHRAATPSLPPSN